MPKMKTRRSAAKRFRVTGSGKLIYNAKGRRHIMAHKSRKRKMHLMGNKLIHRADVAQIKRQLGITAVPPQ